MIEAIEALLTHPATPWCVLIGAGAVIVFEAARLNRACAWSDLFADEADEE